MVRPCPGNVSPSQVHMPSAVDPTPKGKALPLKSFAHLGFGALINRSSSVKRGIISGDDSGVELHSRGRDPCRRHCHRSPILAAALPHETGERQTEFASFPDASPSHLRV